MCENRIVLLIGGLTQLFEKFPALCINDCVCCHYINGKPAVFFRSIFFFCFNHFDIYIVYVCVCANANVCVRVRFFFVFSFAHSHSYVLKCLFFFVRMQVTIN